METIVLGDTHGRSIWKDIVNNETFDRIIFIGDYFDTKDNISARQQIENFKDIVTYKRSNMNKVVLLFGNHDFHYLRNTNERYSGFQQLHKADISELLHHAIDSELINICHTEDNFLFVHAGITKTWCKNNHITNDASLQHNINTLFKHKPNSFRFTPGNIGNPYGDEVCQSPIWIRPKSLLRDKINGYIQIVGHTIQNQLIISNDVILIDTLGTSKEYLKITDGSVYIKTIK